MDFARRQLEKYGWSDGKGLGKNENGISEALKPKLKRSVTGIGHDAAAEFNEHWWSALYDKAAKNVEVKEKNGKTKRIKTVEDFTITNNTWKINKKSKTSDDNENGYSEYFIKKATLTNDGTKMESEESGSECEREKKDVFQMTDEELFKACEGRTAHKGARHGLKAIGKLARIAEQEQKLLTQTKYQDYSHAKKLQKSDEEIVENTSLADNEEEKPKSKKKKKKKRCLSNGNIENCEAEYETLPVPSENLQRRNGDTSEENEVEFGRQSKKSTEDVVMESSSIEIVKKSKKNKKRAIDDTETEKSNPKLVEDVEMESSINEIVKKSKKNKKENTMTVESKPESVEIVEDSIADVPKKKKKKKDRKSDKA